MKNKCKRHEKKRIVGNYELLEILGTGSFSSVWIAKHKITNFNVAIKIVNRRTLISTESKIRFEKEISLLKQLHHPFIVGLFEIIEDDDAIYCVMENVERGNLLDYINSHGCLDEGKARRYFSQLISALDYLHNKKFIVHRDLKAENILIDKYDNIRLIDFGFSCEFSKLKPELTTACGSPAYAAPEMIQGQSYTKSADIWSAGVVLYAMVAGILPFDDENTQTVLQKIVYTDVVYPPTMSRSLIDLLKRLLIKDPSKRLSISQISQHPWFIQGEYAPIIDFYFKINSKAYNFFNNNNNINIHDNNSSQTPLINSYAINNSNIIDKSIVEQMKLSGYDVSSLTQLLLLDEFSKPLTTIYRMLLKNKLTETTRAIMESLSKKSNWTVPNQQLFMAPVKTPSFDIGSRSSIMSDVNSNPKFDYNQDFVLNQGFNSSSSSNYALHSGNSSDIPLNRPSYNYAYNSNGTTNLAFHISSTSDLYSNNSIQLGSSGSSSSTPSSLSNNSFINNTNNININNSIQKQNLENDQPNTNNIKNFENAQQPQQTLSFDLFPSQHPQQPPQVLQLIAQAPFALPKKTRMSLQSYIPPPIQFQNQNNNSLQIQPMQIHLHMQPNQTHPLMFNRRRRMSRPIP